MGTLLFVQSTSNQMKHHLHAFFSFFGSIVRCPRLGWFIVCIYYSGKAAPILSALFAPTIFTSIHCFFFLLTIIWTFWSPIFFCSTTEKNTYLRIHFILVLTPQFTRYFEETYKMHKTIDDKCMNIEQLEKKNTTAFHFSIYFQFR